MSYARQHNQTLWYTRRGSIVQGPFPPGLIMRYVIIGRILMSDELSQDRISWTPLSGLSELIPDFLKDDDIQGPDAQRRLAAATRWEDERVTADRRGATAGNAEERRHRIDRRQPAVVSPRPDRHEAPAGADLTGRRHRLIAGGTALGAVVFVLVMVFFYSPPPEDVVDCSLPAQPGVNWNHCFMEGRVLSGRDLRGANMSNMALIRADLSGSRMSNADLSYSNLSVASLREADLSGAILIGASLRGADLTATNLERSNLSYANFLGANLDRAHLRGAKLDNAIWTDGSVCAPNSTDGCLTLP